MNDWPDWVRVKCSLRQSTSDQETAAALLLFHWSLERGMAGRRKEEREEEEGGGDGRRGFTGRRGCGVGDGG